MRKEIYFDRFDGKFWPDPKELEHYFLAPAEKRWTYDTGNDQWMLRLQGFEGTEHLEQNKGRIDIDLFIYGHRKHGVLLIYARWDGVRRLCFHSKGDLSRLREITRSVQGSPLPVGLFIPYEKGWQAVKESMEREGALPTSIEWVSDDDLPPDTYPDPIQVRRQPHIYKRVP